MIDNKEFITKQNEGDEKLYKINKKIEECYKHLEECKQNNTRPTNFFAVQELINEVSSLADRILNGYIDIKTHTQCRNLVSSIMKNKYDKQDNMIYDLYKTYGLKDKYKPASYSNIFEAYKKQFPFYINLKLCLSYKFIHKDIFGAFNFGYRIFDFFTYFLYSS